MFQKLKKYLCRHDYELIGLFYKESFSKYKDGLDKVNVYKKYKCSKCSKIDNVLISTEEFKNNCSGNSEKINYKYGLEGKGIKREVYLYL